jgi:hypothetical protein
VLVATGAACVLTGCEQPTPPIRSSAPGAGGSPGAVPGGSNSPATPGVTSGAGAPDLSLFPDHDTPLAAAPAPLQSAWRPLGVTVIPSRHVFDSVPKPPSAIRLDGTIDQATADARVAAAYRTAALQDWSEKTRQLAFRLHLLNPRINDGLRYESDLAAGATIQHSGCDLYPTQVTVLGMPSTSASIFTAHGQKTSAPSILNESFRNACETRALFPDGHVDVISTSTPLPVLVATAVRHDHVLGDVAYSDALLNCIPPLHDDALAQLCGVSG